MVRAACMVAACLTALAISPSTAAAAGDGDAGDALAGASNALVQTTLESEQTVPVTLSQTPPAGRSLSADRVLEIAGSLKRIRSLRASHPGSKASVFLVGEDRWNVDYYDAKGSEIGEVVIADDGGHVLEVWTGIQTTWSMARGRPGAFGGLVNAVWIWLPLCVLFLAPFVDWRKPLRLVHLDLLVLLSFSVSLAFFNHALIYESVPLVYPPLLYLLGRMLWLALRGARGELLRVRVDPRWLAVGLAFLIPFRIALNVTNGNVIDVGYAGVIGASRIVEGQPLYGGYPKENAHGDTYGPFAYEAYVPFEQVFGWSGTWDSLPAAHGAAIVFDLLAMLLLFLLGRRVRGPSLGLALAYAWAAYPFTFFAMESDSNDALLAVCVLLALLASRPTLRGVGGALAGLTKFAPLALAPLLAGETFRVSLHGSRRWLALVAFLVGFLATAALVFVLALAHDSLQEIYDRTLRYQGNRETPFSIWGLVGLGPLRTIVEVAATLLALGIAVLPRPAGLGSLAAASAAVLIAVQLCLSYWFYLYIPWFFTLVLLALAAPAGAFSARRERAAASGPARLHLPSAAASS